jgi:hypothetical protein
MQKDGHTILPSLQARFAIMNNNTRIAKFHFVQLSLFYKQFFPFNVFVTWCLGTNFMQLTPS